MASHFRFSASTDDAWAAAAALLDLDRFLVVVVAVVVVVVAGLPSRDGMVMSQRVCWMESTLPRKSFTSEDKPW